MHTCNCHPDPSAEAGLTLAMATVPLQPWEPPYDPEKALRQGTIFPGLDKPFYVVSGSDITSARTADMAPSRGQTLLQAFDFTITELMLYMDTHPEDADAKEALNQASEQYSHQKREITGKPHFAWSDGPLPWDNQTTAAPAGQGGAN